METKKLLLILNILQAIFINCNVSELHRTHVKVVEKPNFERLINPIKFLYKICTVNAVSDRVDSNGRYYF